MGMHLGIPVLHDSNSGSGWDLISGGKKLGELHGLDRGATNVLLNSVSISDFQINEEFENVYSGCDSCRHLARHYN